ncbi:hypothetical protein SAMN05421774_11259 [Gemmobacter megaterium]|uniref:Uncharacterized protein n=1 Tax=Gemmobacter megaterium TaxID=1086013 RepID=A0A1N7QJS8_9RHOB|nr:hypothetical protein [Gemmobacter megaterium]GGE26569.1 hypothetical protein GCM10011345_35680 [Gemmobacter megaterium]SIT22757.1 hypothetical protein SAMN05421774_11259 [Gemmobacter megaterium]
MTFDPRAEVIGVLDLVSIDTPDGVFRFLVGVDGIFTDVDGHQWIGSRLIGASDLRPSIQGEAAGGSLTLAFIPDPDGADLIAEVRALGTDYIRDREIIFWDQPLLSMAEFHAPTLPPQRFLTRRGRDVQFDLSGALERRITLNFEGPFTGRNRAPGLQYTVADHSRLIGAGNASLRFMPTDMFQEQKLFG